MSLIWSIKKLFDPLAHHREEGEARAEREQPRQNPEEGDPPRFDMAPGPPPPAPAPPARFRCRVCDHMSTDSAYCPACLADTMTAEE